MSSTHIEDIQAAYGSRAQDYNNSWHMPYAASFVDWVSPIPGDHILDLACGTGLLTLAAKKVVGPEGRVIGVDVTPGMLGIARAAAKKENVDVKFIEHDITDLESIEGDWIPKGGFDIIMCANALVLLPDPFSAMKKWAKLLKPGGRVAVDVPTEDTMVAGLVLEEVGKELSIPPPSHRLWVTDQTSVEKLFEDTGLEVERVWRQDGFGESNMLDAEQGGDLFEKFANSPHWKRFTSREARDKAKELFIEHFKRRVGSDSKVYDGFGLYVGIGRKPLGA
ncbi:MAG: hypothetical protein M1834_009062 [Cirrosporium novae-zelandiae]|nr:MAG: hypothetical protein M1834_009062 [Cirrosporium novae-zelandiae]